jgi:hypothetical protein
MAALELEPFDPEQVLKPFTWETCADIFEEALTSIAGDRPSRTYQEATQPQTVASGG